MHDWQLFHKEVKYAAILNLEPVRFEQLWNYLIPQNELDAIAHNVPKMEFVYNLGLRFPFRLNS